MMGPADVPAHPRALRLPTQAEPPRLCPPLFHPQLAEYIAFHRTSEELSSIKGRMAGLQAALEAQLAEVEATQAALHALAAAAGGGGGARAAAEASLYSAVAGGEAARLRRRLAQQSAAVDGTLSEMRALEAQLDEAKAVRTAAYAAKLEGLAGAIAAKHAAGGAARFAPGERLVQRCGGAGGRRSTDRGQLAAAGWRRVPPVPPPTTRRPAATAALPPQTRPPRCTPPCWPPWKPTSCGWGAWRWAPACLTMPWPNRRAPRARWPTTGACTPRRAASAVRAAAWPTRALRAPRLLPRALWSSARSVHSWHRPLTPCAATCGRWSRRRRTLGRRATPRAPPRPPLLPRLLPRLLQQRWRAATRWHRRRRCGACAVRRTTPRRRARRCGTGACLPLGWGQAARAGAPRMQLQACSEPVPACALCCLLLLPAPPLPAP